jgi:putative ABC transport system permease protein
VVTFGTADSPAGASVVAFEAATAQELVAEPGTWDGIGVVAEQGISQTQVVEQIRPTLPSGVEVLTGEEITAENQNAIEQSLGFFNTFLLVFALIALAVGSFTIYNTFSILVAQRAQEVALVRAVGASRRQVLGGVLAEAFVVGLVSSLVGLLAGIALAAGLKSLLASIGLDLPGSGLVLLPRTVTIALVAGVLVTVFSAFFPARRAARVPPVAAMREVAVDRSATSPVRLVLGLVVLALGGAGLIAGLAQNELPLVGLGAAGTFLGLVILGPVIARPLSHVLGAPLPVLKGITGRLAVQNTTRNPKRTAATASAIMIGLGLIMFITIFADSAKASIDSIVDDNFRGDFVLSAGGGFGPTSGIPTELAEDIAAVDGVSAVTNLRFGFANIDGGGDVVIGIDPVTGLELFNIGVIEGSPDDLGPGTIAVDDDRMEARGWVLGDTISFQSPTSSADLRIAMVYTEDRLANRYVLPLVEFDRQFPNSLDAQIYAKVADGADSEQVRAELEALVAPYGTVELLDRTEFKAEQAAQINQFLNIIYALLALAVIIAFFGIANTLALSIIERQREIGIQRAVGMTRGQLRSTIRWESVIIALMGTALGVAVGVFFSWAIVRALNDQGFTIYRVPVVQLVIWAVVAAALAVAMAWLPARRAAKTDILAAIATE